MEAARLAPSGANGQPWRFRLEHDALVMSAAKKTYWTAPIDYGIAMLHIELGAAREGVHGVWDVYLTPTSRGSSPSRSHQRDGSRIAVGAWRSRGLTLTLDLSVR